MNDVLTLEPVQPCLPVAPYIGGERKLWDWIRGPFIRRAWRRGFHAGKSGAFREMNPWRKGLRAYAWERGRQEGDVAR